MKCKKCGQEIDKKAEICVHCGCKIKKSIFKKWWFWVLSLIVVCSIFSSPNSTEKGEVVKVDSGEQSVKVEEPVISEEEYKASCTFVSYKDIARNPNNHVGQKAVFTGKVIQVQESGKRVVLRVSVTKGEYGIWDDTVYVDYRRKEENESRVLEDDIITMYGEIQGIKEYTSVLGSQISIPHMQAEYIEIN
ncbi:MAG: zinc ribbon domain-containing protein [Ruminococcaceae bacterium]|nr:zinc ribbon domain-containing protein [Oscillospiraceae bacterium]